MNLSRRLTCALVLAAALVSGCEAPSITAQPKLASDQTLRVMLEDQPASLDAGQTQYPYETAVLRAIDEPLLRPKPGLDGVAPAAAESYDVNSAGAVYAFHLRPNAKYWDGTPVKAADFVFAWQRLIDPRLAAPNETLFEIGRAHV